MRPTDESEDEDKRDNSDGEEDQNQEEIEDFMEGEDRYEAGQDKAKMKEKVAGEDSFK
jgi:hypothetical protein